MSRARRWLGEAIGCNSISDLASHAVTKIIVLLVLRAEEDA